MYYIIGMESALANSEEEKQMLQEKISQLSVQLLEKEQSIKGDSMLLYSDDYDMSLDLQSVVAKLKGTQTSGTH